jgi:hypothetical protein
MADSHKANLRLKLIAVGHGDALILHWQPPNGTASTILIDGGPKAGGIAIPDALKDLGAKKIDLAVLTHCDADHVDGLVEYANNPKRLLIERFWGPCVPAFRRHDWLFPQRIARGLRMTEMLEGLLTGEAQIVYPVEGAQWTSSDRDLTVRVISPAGRFIERLLVGTDSDDLFLRYPTPLGWLLEVAPPLDPEDPFTGLRVALSSGEISRDLVPVSPPARRTFDVSEIGEVARQSGVDPEFFGNNVLNDTSIVLLVEVRLGAVRRRLLFTGDLENFTYLMAVHPMGLGCDVVKAPHHGSRSYIESSQPAFDEVWQWLRPKAALVSANGKHQLPRLDFRDAALRYGATLFCTCRRSREILVGPRNEASCHTQFNCGSLPQDSVTLTMTERAIESNAIACAIGGASGVTPILQMAQHTIEPSNILDRFTERELRLHASWAVDRLRSMHAQRRHAGGEAGLSAVPMQELARAAAAAGRYAAAANVETVLQRAARESKVWITPPSGYRSVQRNTWVLPSTAEWQELKDWIEGYLVIQLAIFDRKVGLVPRELLLAADTGFLSKRAAANFSFPEEMFYDAIWPTLVDHLLRQRTVATRAYDDRITAVVVLAEADLGSAYSSLVQRLPRSPVRSLMQANEAPYSSKSSFEGPWPAELVDLLAPFWREKDRLIPRETLSLIKSCYPYEEWNEIQSLASKESCEDFQFTRETYSSKRQLTEQAACEIFAASLVSRLNVL